MLATVTTELEEAMTLSGCRDVGEVTGDLLAPGSHGAGC
jgi:isopentenyl diphosphate isomerase/L-lactate dehydrogenase-like FMN-dependent dehydrogenase